MYFVFIFIILLLSAVLPSLYLFIIDGSSSTWDQMVTRESMPEGLYYTLVASLIFIGIALINRPAKPSAGTSPPKLSARLMWICWSLGVIAHVVTTLLNLRYGMSQSNLVAQRPPAAVMLGYLAAIGGIAGTGFFFHELRFVGLSKRLLIYLLLQSAAFATAWSRAALVYLGCLTILGLAYSQRRRIIRLPSVRTLVISAILVVVATGSAFYGQTLRGGDTDSRAFLLEGMQRLFANQVALFIAIDRFDDVNQIILEDEPEVALDQMFSFVRTRTKYPSSFRFIELDGGTVEPDERGHISGYAFGWLGLTYGIGRFWGGLILVTGVLWIHFRVMLACHRRAKSLLALLFFSVFASSLVEFFSNLGLDSFCEKLFKNSLYAVVTYFSVTGIAFLLRRRPQNRPTATPQVTVQLSQVQT